MEIINKNWLSHFKRELTGTKVVRIISPFVSDKMVDHLLEKRTGNSIRFITRYNIQDFASKVSSLKALESLLLNRVQIKGIKELHSKTYIFDAKSAIITSANFTVKGFSSNYEFGVITHDRREVQEAIAYFESLWRSDLNILTQSKIELFKKDVDAIPKSSVHLMQKDYGASPDRTITSGRRYFVKFYGNGKERAQLTETVKDQIAGTHCHFALSFPRRRDNDARPRRYRDGDVVYIARTVEGRDYAIFGKAIARHHQDDRDVASEEDIRRIGWKANYPIYIRVHSGEFIDTTFENCPMLQHLMANLKGESFESAKLAHGETEINPRLSLRNQSDVRLSEKGASWLEQKFEEAKSKYSTVPDDFIAGLYQGDPHVE